MKAGPLLKRLICRMSRTTASGGRKTGFGRANDSRKAEAEPPQMVQSWVQPRQVMTALLG